MRTFLVIAVCCLGFVIAATDPYEVLELKKSANPSPAEIKKAYRRLSLLYHPDKSVDPQAKQKMEAISAAYEQIGDPDKKVIFDEFGTDEKYYSKWHYEQAQRMKGKTVSKKGFYTQSEEVKTLTSANFWGFTQKTPALINFYASWCTHCQQMVGEYKKTGILLEDVARVGAVNCEAEANLCNRYGVQGYPSLMLFTKGGEVETYAGGEHTADAIYGWVQQTINHNVITLTNKDFSLVNNGSLWIVDFSAGQWCGPCTALKPSLRKLSAELQGIAKVGIVECDQQQLCSDNGVTYYPQVRLFLKDRLPATGQLLEMNQNFPAAGMLDIIGTLAKLFLPRPATEPVEQADQAEIDQSESTSEAHSDL
jgi:curved DNA-binding protein CbpA